MREDAVSSMLERVSPPLVRAPVRSRLGCGRWDLGPIQFVRITSQQLLGHVPLYLGSGRRVVVFYVLVTDLMSHPALALVLPHILVSRERRAFPLHPFEIRLQPVTQLTGSLSPVLGTPPPSMPTPCKTYRVSESSPWGAFALRVPVDGWRIPRRGCWMMYFLRVLFPWLAR